EPADTSDDEVQEYKDDDPAPKNGDPDPEVEVDFLPDDAQEKALALPPEPKKPVVRSLRRVVKKKALAPPPELSSLVRSPRRARQEAGRRAEQAEQRKLEREFEQRRLEAEQRKYRAWADEDWPGYDWAEIEGRAADFSCIEYRHDDEPRGVLIIEVRHGKARLVRTVPDWMTRLSGHRHNETFIKYYDDPRWARISKRPGPPRDPRPERDNEWRPPSDYLWWKHRHRGFMTSLAGARGPGRPKKANKLTNAEKSKRYRDRKRARNPK